MIILWNHKFLWKFTPMHHLDGRSILNEYLLTSDSSDQSPSTSITFIDLPSSSPKVSTSPPSIDQHLPTNPPSSYEISSGPPETTHIVASLLWHQHHRHPIWRLHHSYPILNQNLLQQTYKIPPNQKTPKMENFWWLYSENDT